MIYDNLLYSTCHIEKEEKPKTERKEKDRKMSLNNLERDVKLKKKNPRFIKSFEYQGPELQCSLNIKVDLS